ncbi:unnamed protein product [Ceutorhynchus assimilis]|uniref:Uncharacterized protein n=1 Tax=Ceutorhynchus assimilis TaxID=467358 RepID=A0A9N9MNJ1_9CUCU|nr:unnamed protein product [Ceutorhynchus assimilis]
MDSLNDSVSSSASSDLLSQMEKELFLLDARSEDTKACKQLLKELKANKDTLREARLQVLINRYETVCVMKKFEILKNKFAMYKLTANSVVEQD